ncbi:MAG: hypothetical protein ABI665_25795 [Vicinamibacterales bacterium]
MSIIATRSETPARTKFRTALRRMSCGMRPGHPAARHVRIVAIGDREATITFEADFVVKLDATWEEPDEDRDETHIGEIEEDVSVSGTAKVRFDAKLEKLVAAPHVSLDATDIELRRIPDGHWRNYHR